MIPERFTYKQKRAPDLPNNKYLPEGSRLSLGRNTRSHTQTAKNAKIRLIPSENNLLFGFDILALKFL